MHRRVVVLCIRDQIKVRIVFIMVFLLEEAELELLVRQKQEVP